MKEYSIEDDFKLALVACESSAKMLYMTNDERQTITKKDGSPVTRQDVYSQEKIIDIIKKERSCDLFLAEESDIEVSRNGRVWIIDPIDGTANYAAHIPFSAINISLQDNYIPRVSLTMSIFQSEYIYRIGLGPIRYVGSDSMPSIQRKKPMALIDTIPADVNHDKMAYIASKLYDSRIGIRSLGSAALGTMYVAMGRADVYFAPRLHLWDVAPALHYAIDNDYEIRTLDGGQWNENESGFCMIRRSCRQIYEVLGWKEDVI